MSDKVQLEITPFTALTILSFCREFINVEVVAGDPKFDAILESVVEFEGEVQKKMTNEHFDDAIAVNEVNKLTGKYKNPQ